MAEYFGNIAGWALLTSHVGIESTEQGFRNGFNLAFHAFLPPPANIYANNRLTSRASKPIILLTAHGTAYRAALIRSDKIVGPTLRLVPDAIPLIDKHYVVISIFR